MLIDKPVLPPSPDWEVESGEIDKFKKIKLVILISLITALVAAGLVYYFFYYQNNKKADSATIESDIAVNWPEYKNTLYGYSLKYPTGWEFEEKDISDVKFSKKVSDPTLGNSKNTTFQIKSEISKDEVDLKTWIATEKNKLDIPSSNVIVGGRIALKIEEESLEEVYLFADEVKYKLMQKEASKKEFADILKTFKLIARENPSDTKTTDNGDQLTQTYTNEKYGILLKYPEEWMTKDLNQIQEPHILLEVAFQPQDAPDAIPFILEVTDRSVESELTLYKAALEKEKILSEVDSELGDAKGKKVVSQKGNIEKVAIILAREKYTYIFKGISKDPASSFDLFYDRMISSINFLKV